LLLEEGDLSIVGGVCDRVRTQFGNDFFEVSHAHSL